MGEKVSRSPSLSYIEFSQLLFSNSSLLLKVIILWEHLLLVFSPTIL